jgi:hypothetical protein
VYGWKRYTGTATLYNLDKIAGGRRAALSKFKVDLNSRAGALPLTKSDPGLSPNATVGNPVRHDMAACWNTFGLRGTYAPRW